MDAILEHLPQLGGFRYHYSIQPSNFKTLPPAEQKTLVDTFVDFFAYLDNDIQITLMKTNISIPVQNKTEIKEIPRIFFSSPTEIDAILTKFGYEFESVIVPPFPIINKEKRTFLKLESSFGDKQLARVNSIVKFPQEPEFGWIKKISENCDCVKIHISKYDNDDARKIINAKIRSLRENKLAPDELYERMTVLEQIRTDLRREHTNLFRIVVNALVISDSLTSLKKKEKIFKKDVLNFEGRAKYFSAIQASSLYENNGLDFNITKGSLSAFYTFDSIHMLELPNGIPLGRNLIDNSPVIFDFFKRRDSNMAIMGKTRSGKSVTGKIIVNRKMKKYPKARFYILDPMGEWGHISSFFGLSAIKIFDSKTGFDPFMSLTPMEAASLVSEVTESSPDISAEYLANCSDCKSLKDLYDKVSDKAKKQMEHLIKGPLSEFFSGDVTLDERTIISLKGLDPFAKTTTMILYVILRQIWKEIGLLEEDATKNQTKFIVIDEAWILFRLPGSRSFINRVLRTGGKLNIKFILLSQKVEDFVTDFDGDGAAISSIGTKIIHMLEKNDAQLAQQEMKLSDFEVQQIPNQNPGEAILITEKHRFPIKFEATPEEFEHFDTRPLGIADLVPEK